MMSRMGFEKLRTHLCILGCSFGVVLAIAVLKIPAAALNPPPLEPQLSEKKVQNADVQILLSTSDGTVAVWSQFDRNKNQSRLFTQQMGPKNELLGSPLILGQVEGQLRVLQGKWKGNRGWVTWLSEITPPEKIEHYEQQTEHYEQQRGLEDIPEEIPRSIILGAFRMDQRGKLRIPIMKLNQFIAANPYQEGDDIGNLFLSLIATSQGDGLIISSSNAARCIFSKKQLEKIFWGEGTPTDRCPFFDVYEVSPSGVYRRLAHRGFPGFDPEIEEIVLRRNILRIKVTTHTGESSDMQVFYQAQKK